MGTAEEALKVLKGIPSSTSVNPYLVPNNTVSNSTQIRQTTGMDYYNKYATQDINQNLLDRQKLQVKLTNTGKITLNTATNNSVTANQLDTVNFIIKKQAKTNLTNVAQSVVPMIANAVATSNVSSSYSNQTNQSYLTLKNNPTVNNALPSALPNLRNYQRTTTSNANAKILLNRQPVAMPRKAFTAKPLPVAPIVKINPYQNPNNLPIQARGNVNGNISLLNKFFRCP